ncbi:putative heme/steroid binding protein [Geothermobacter ehrlichii]|uniref:Putative heme/steroid binding protein n=1 Tax=Geothermobacter ehrlichii TaxID=213224 RepID=A0A5D3WKY5_9BACT|nr:cytochrome b5 domain-containing protein [Geothermobacter ehrlichii]TYO99048.1 putative heme/steroid binding protein [Geothermobacter ehrlichii]
MTREELARHDGREGRKAYVAVNGKIYDVSTSPLWAEGNHQDIHQAGADLTEELKSAPHVRAVMERFPVVGRLEEAVTGSSPKAAGLIGATIVAVIALAAVALWLLLCQD